MRLDRRKARQLLLSRGLSGEEADRWLRLHTRAVFASAVMTRRDGQPWQVRPYQRDSLESFAPRKVHCDGRDVGKTTEIEILAAWASVCCPNREMLIATQCENHLHPLMDRLARRFQEIPCLAPSLEHVRRSPSWHLRFTNGFVLWGRIAGPRGMNFQGLHVDWQVVDEAQEMTETAWGELYQALNGGGRRWVYGVPNGLRNTFFRMTSLPGAEHHNWPSSLNPDFTPEKDTELALLYGGRESPGYVHRVLGRHGAPEHAVFDLDAYLECIDEGLDFWQADLGPGDSFEVPSGIPDGDYYLGCDLGYARDPSEFVVYRAEGPYLSNILRVRLRGVDYARQQEVINEIDRACGLRHAALDAGSNGRSVAHHLLRSGPGWEGRLTCVEFGGSVSLDPLPDGEPDRRPAKQFMTELLERRLAERTLRFPRLADRESQYAAHSYRAVPSGAVVYSKGNDHLIDADRCALLAHYLDTHLGVPARAALGVRIEGF